MQAVILAGGLGTRLRPLTWTRPKPLLPVANVPLIRRIIDRLPRNVDKVVIAVNYRPDQLAAYFRENDVGRKVVLVEEKEPLGTGGAIKNVEREIHGTFLVFNADIVDALNIDAMLRFHEEKGGVGTLALHHVQDPRDFGIMQMDGDRIARFVEKPKRAEDAPSRLANAGTYVLESEVFDAMPSGASSVERDVFPRILSEGAQLYGYPFSGFWIDCGKPDTMLRANEAVLRAQGTPRLYGARVEDFGSRVEEWACVGMDSRIGEGADVSRSVLLPNVTVGAKGIVLDSILGENVVIEDGAAVIGCVLGDGAVIGEGVALRNGTVEPGDVVGEPDG
ncbi:MAG: sugar phosphate nucleotidyltransferase [Thermoplasmatota archaeon]